MAFDKLIDILQFREGTEEVDDGTNQPIVTTGSIIWGILLRTSILMLLTFIFISKYEYREYWWMSVFLIWLLAIYPGWRQHQIFQRKMEKFTDETLCGSCKYFDSTSQLCRTHDEHPTKSYIPCEGLDWEPKQFEDKH